MSEFWDFDPRAALGRAMATYWPALILAYVFAVASLASRMRTSRYRIFDSSFLRPLAWTWPLCAWGLLAVREILDHFEGPSHPSSRGLSALTLHCWFAFALLIPPIAVSCLTTGQPRDETTTDQGTLVALMIVSAVACDFALLWSLGGLN